MQARVMHLRILLNVSCLGVYGYREVPLLPLKFIDSVPWSTRVFELMVLNSRERSRMRLRSDGTGICLGSPSAGGCAHPSFSFLSDFCWYNSFLKSLE